MKILTSGTVVRGEEDWARNQLTVSVKSERNPSGNWVWYRREGGSAGSLNVRTLVREASRLSLFLFLLCFLGCYGRSILLPPHRNSKLTS